MSLNILQTKEIPVVINILKTMDYKVAKNQILKLSSNKKSELFEGLENNYNSLNKALKGYYTSPFGSPINQKEYFIIMSALKKLEILIGYCYEGVV